MNRDEKKNPNLIPENSRPFKHSNPCSMHDNPKHREKPLEVCGQYFTPPRDRQWSSNPELMQRVIKANRIISTGKNLAYIMYIDDYPVVPANNFWLDVLMRSEKQYIVETASSVIMRYILMATDPGDLDLKEGLMPHEVGVFVRSESELSRGIAAVKKTGIPFKVLDDNIETTSNHISISTMHLTKGLEFRSVVVMACDDEIIPSQKRIETVSDDTDLEEVYNTERHLLYVVCTRARDNLLISGVDPASEFLDDISRIGVEPR